MARLKKHASCYLAGQVYHWIMSHPAPADDRQNPAETGSRVNRWLADLTAAAAAAWIKAANRKKRLTRR